MPNSDPADESENPLQSILKGAKWVMGGRIVKMTVVFLAQLIIARILGATFYGGLAQANAVAGVAGLIGALGVGSGVSRQLAHFEDEPEKARGVIRAGLVIGLLGTCSVAILLYTNAPILALEVFRDPTLITLFRIVAIGIPIGFLAGFGVSLGKAARDASVHTYVNQIIGPLTRSGFRVGAAVLGLGVVGVVAGGVIASAIMALIGLYLAWRAIPISLRGPTRSMYRNMVTFSVPLMFASGFNFLIGDIDTFLIGAFESSTSVGLYTAVFNLRPMVLVFFFPATYLLPPVMTRLQKEERQRDLRRTYMAISKWTTIVTFPLFLPPFLFPKLIIRLTFGSEYVDPVAALVLRLFAVSMLINVGLGANDRAVVALGHNRTTLYVAAIAASTNFGLNLALIPPYGILGAGIGSITAFALRDVINSVILYRWYGLMPISPEIGRVAGAMAIIVPAGYYAFTSRFHVHILSVVGIGLLFLIIYIPLILRFGTNEELDRDLVRELENSQDMNLDPLRKVYNRINW